MKRCLLFLLLAFITTVSFSKNKKEVDVYLIGGQSNATGQGYMANIPDSFEIDKSVRFFYSQFLGGGGKSLEWGPLCQASEVPARFGVELSMGTILKELNPNREIALIKHALSGSNLYNQWNPGENESDIENFGLEFSKFINTVEKGLKQLEAEGFTPKIKAMVWQQGEGDARDIAGMENSRNYGNNLRHLENIDFDKWKFQDVYEHWQTDKYREVQKTFDDPYNQLPAPSKILGGALEFNIDALGAIKTVTLDVEKALCLIEWENGAKLTTFVHAEKPLGWYKFENLPEDFEVDLISPDYNKKGDRQHVDQSMADLDQLGYQQGEIVEDGNSFTYDQKGWGDFAYQIHTRWERDGNDMTGVWSVSSENKDWPSTPKAAEVVSSEIAEGIASSLKEHTEWWKNYWSRSHIQIPDSLLEKQYYLEMYKFGAAARADAPPISLQSVWTADNGKLPPWKGDYHHDLNTQLSYWPAYTGNYLHLEEGFLNWLWKYRPTFKQYTKDFFDVEGMNVPGVSTLEGEPMGGWIQYSFGQTVASWLAHHFYMHWQFSMDRDFLEQRAYPWIKDVAIFLDQVAVRSDNGQRKLLISSSPEIYDNSAKAWFSETTNYDLSLIRWTYEKAAELATELNKDEEAKKWNQILSEWPDLDIDTETGLTFAPGLPYFESHRHFSHLMAIHPLGLVDFSNGEDDKQIILNTLKALEDKGSRAWTGYSFSWQGNLYARAFEGDKAADALRIFAECFCLKNSFHANGDQCKAGHSGFTYRPFTLEGNFAFASAIQEMLIQSHTGIIHVFPAIPTDWQDARFDKLRARGAFLVSAQMQNGLVAKVEVTSEKGGELLMNNPFGEHKFSSSKDVDTTNGLIRVNLQIGETVSFELKQ